MLPKVTWENAEVQYQRVSVALLFDIDSTTIQYDKNIIAGSETQKSGDFVIIALFLHILYQIFITFKVFSNF